jgi:dihydrofolate reductase
METTGADMSMIVIEFVTLDGVVSDPDGSAGTPTGGWAFRFGPEAVAGDKFKLGSALETGVMLLGRNTWELFSRLWPTRTDPFSTAMNRIPKLVVTSTLTDTTAWANSSVVEGDLVAEVTRVAAEREVIITGSLSVVRTLAEHDLVDEYRLITFPTVIGSGQRLFAGGGTPFALELTSVERVGAASLTRYHRSRD